MESSRPLPFLREHLLSGKYSDLLIQCEDQVFKAHKAIVCSQSPFFNSAISGDFQESHEGKIKLQDEDADTVRRFLSYLYTQDYDQGTGGLALNERKEIGTDTEAYTQDANTAQPTMVAEAASVSEVKEIAHNNLLVYIAADKFGTDSLKQLARDRLFTWANNNWSDKCFPDAVREIINLAPPHEMELCGFLSSVISENYQNLVEQESMLDVLEESGALATAVLKKLAGCLRHSEEERERLTTLCIQDSFGHALMTRVNSLTMCRHCHAEFNLRVESNAIGWLRCGSCRTRH